MKFDIDTKGRDKDWYIHMAMMEEGHEISAISPELFEETKKSLPLFMNKAIGKPADLVTDVLVRYNLAFRVARENGLLTAEVEPNRWTLIIDEQGIIKQAYLG